MSNFTLDIDADGIALVTWDMAGRSMNVINADVLEELSALNDKIAADAAIKGAVVTSGKETFCAGADLTMLERMSAIYTAMVRNDGEQAAAQMVFDESRKASQLYRRIETSGKPWVCALNGTAMGGGFELALACHHRVAADNPKTRLGLPEIKVGLFPGAGGTQRVARMIAPADALQFLLKGEQLKVDRAKAMKLIDAVVPAADLIKTAKDWIKAGGKAVAPWDEKGFRLPGGPVYSKAGMMTFPAANAIYRRETYDNYPAARAILQVVYEGLQLPMDVALRVESRWFAKILRSPEAAAMIRTLFVSMQELNKGARRPADVPPATLKKIGIVGAGFMGAGIAQVSAAAGLAVVLIDRDQETADKGKAGLHKALSDRVAKGRMKGAERDGLLSLHHAERRLRRAEGLRPGDRGGVRGPQGEIRCDGENPGGHRRQGHLRLQHLDAADHLARVRIQGPGALHRHPFLLAGRPHDAGRDHPRQADRRQGAGRRARLCARHPQDADRRQRLARLLRQPLRARQLHPGRPSDAAGRHAGGDDRERRAHGRHAGRPAVAQRRGRARSRPGRSCAPPKPISAPAPSIRGRRSCWRIWWRSAAATAARTARASTIIRKAAPKRLWPGLAELQPKALSRDEVEALDVEELKQRFLVVQAVEAARTFEEKVVTDVREADVGSILGFGLCAVLRRHAVLHRHDGHEEIRRAVPQAGKEIRRALCAVQAAHRHGRARRGLLPALRAGKRKEAA